MLDIERQAKRAREVLAMPVVQEAMAIRCEEQGHDWRNGCDAFLRVFQLCQWCGERR